MSKLEHTTPPKGDITLTNKDRHVSSCTWHLNQDQSAEFTELNAHQAMMLRVNIKAKLNELLHEAIFIHLGRTPKFDAVTGECLEIQMELHKVKFSDNENFYYWGDTPILFYTEPKSRITEMKNKQGGKYYLTWYHRILTTLERN